MSLNWGMGKYSAFNLSNEILPKNKKEWTTDRPKNMDMYSKSRADPVWSRCQPWHTPSSQVLCQSWGNGGITGMPLRRAQNTQNHKSEHMDKDPIWTSISEQTDPCGLSELRAPITQFWSLFVPCMGHTQSPLYMMHAAILATWLKTDACPSTCRCCQWLGLHPGCWFSCLLLCKLSVSVL